MFSDKIKHVRSSEAEVEWECFAWLTIRRVPLCGDMKSNKRSGTSIRGTYNSARHSINTTALGADEMLVDVDALLSSSARIATMTAGMS
jgi:hypothetical protein